MFSTDYTISQEMLDKLAFRIGDEALSSRACELKTWNDYSNHDMYGKTCVGFEVDADLTYLAMGLGAILADMEESEELVTVDGDVFGWYDLKHATDNMGHGSILYFPNLNVEKTSKEYRNWIAE